ncbi:hypothetical protein [Phytomonospora endophytica]|uniref:Uncharacterized protein n=1 Tax=Phytomonospora endophytica TaxID=714109 RepID=A0A841FV26_9ACTN|nr:hypothetical protein [Phytomonospora endophytica]MBB6039624.1 hypothetical protein [Phytomonospora endophytica]
MASAKNAGAVGDRTETVNTAPDLGAILAETRRIRQEFAEHGGGPLDNSNVELVLPVGHFAGPMFTRPEAEAPESFEVRFRDGVFSLSAAEYAVWAVAHGDPESVGASPTTRAMVEDAASRAGVREPAPLFDGLAKDGLLVRTRTSGPDAEEFARRHQIRPLALGLGNTPQSLGGFQIGMPNAPRATVGYDVYHMWLFAHQAENLWGAISTIAAEAAAANLEEGDEGVRLIEDPETLLTGFLNAMPVLVSTSCVYIDRC